VHALNQVIHFDSHSTRPLTAWVRGVNTLLPNSVAVQWARAVSEEFHARNCARGRVYLYLLINRPERPGVHHARAGWHHRPLDIDRMRGALQPLLGKHDFSAFRAAECQAASPVKQLRRAEVRRVDDLLVFEFAADAFLHHMVRNIIGSVVKVGDGSRPMQWLQQVLESRDRTQAAPTFSPNGLYLAAVEYDAHWGLPESRSRQPADVLLGVAAAPTKMS
jgi:tRNA pseudouridine38-40 synthase